MKKSLLGAVIIGLVLVNLFNVSDTKQVLANDAVVQKVDIESFYSGKDNIVQNEIIVKYKREEKGSKILSYFFGAKDSEPKIEKIKVKDNEKLENRIEELEKDPNVEAIQPNYIYEKANIDKTQAPSNNASNSSGIDSLQWHLQKLQIPEIWQQATGKGITIAVIDTGINVNHQELTGQVIG